MAENVKLTLDEVFALSKSALMNCGADDANATEIANQLRMAEHAGAHAHGLFRLPWYAGMLQSGKANGSAEPTLERLTSSAIRLHGHNGFAPLALKVGRAPLIEAARAQGIAVLAMTRVMHIGALWPETSALAEAGLAAIAMTSAKPMVAPAGGKKPFFGTNPLAFAWPRGDKPPMIIDMATAAMARGEIQIAARDGHTVPDGAGIDPDGNPTNDPNEILKGAQLAFGGAKGALMALWVDMMVGPLLGEPYSKEQSRTGATDDGVAAGGEIIIAMDPARLSTRDDAIAHGEELIKELLAEEGTRLPGARRIEARPHTEKNGVEIPVSLHQTIIELCG